MSFVRRVRLWYQLVCAREDARHLGVVVPSGVWACAPCRGVFLDDLEFVVHAH
ncbi:MAG: hypothetical protein ACTHMS_15240 [Jatrophihabitans sp.]|uniref:hypothetical protein n=1 Tax=Jatrophihabitans sp. TaxID=1932789 RepID=UPI003F7F98D4